MVRLALDLHLFDSRGDNTDSSVTITGDCLYDIFKKVTDLIVTTYDVEYARVWYLTQSVAELEAHGDGWWNWVKQWYLTTDELEKLMKEVLC